MNAIMEVLHERLQEKTHVTTEGSLEITWEAIVAISEYLWDKYGISHYDCRDAIGDVVGKELVTKKGKFPKRMRDYCKEIFNTKLTPEDLSTIGNLINLYRNKQSEYWVDITDTFNWSDGMFGHSGSCYWGQYAASRDTLEYYHSLCLRGYRSENDWHGNSRVWIVRVPDYNAIALFNSYGLEMSEQVSILRAVYPELSWKKVRVYNYEDSTIPYINSGGKNGAVLWLSGEDEPEDGINVDMKAIEGEYFEECNNHLTCVHCGDRVDEDSITFVHDNPYCDDCLSEFFSYCDMCGEYQDADEVHPTPQHPRYSYLCEYHLSELGYAECERCGDWSDEYIVTEDTGNVYCDTCAESAGVYRCNECENYFENEPFIVDSQHEPYCEDCAKRLSDLTEDPEAHEPEGDYRLYRDELNFRSSLENNYNFLDNLQ